jgi:NitT/TauT family transport system substrate-binding protein
VFRHFKWISLALALVLVTSVSAAAQNERRELRFFLPFIPNIQFAPVYVAIANGYFAEEGLDVVVEYGDENVAVDLLAANELQFGMISGEQVILARAGGRPVVYVYQWFQQFPVGVVVPDTSGVEAPEDLAGRRIGIPGLFGASYTGIVALLGSAGLAESDVQLEPIGFVAPDVVCAGGVEVSVVYVNNEPLQIQQRADAGECGDITSVDVIYIGDYVDLVSNGVTTNEQTIAEDPELVAAVVRAFDKGLRDTINNPAQAYLLSRDFVEDLPVDDAFVALLEEQAAAQTEFLATEPDRAAITESRAALEADLSEVVDPQLLIQFRVLLATIALWDADDLGMTDADAWATTQEALLTVGALRETTDLEGAFTNEFVPVAESE